MSDFITPVIISVIRQVYPANCEKAFLIFAWKALGTEVWYQR